MTATVLATECREKPAIQAASSGSRQISRQSVASWAFSFVIDGNPGKAEKQHDLFPETKGKVFAK
jgi:hypothetical protein